jgi:purine-binding chemotaxis protein CheW
MNSAGEVGVGPEGGARRLLGLRIGQEWHAIPAELGEEVLDAPDVRPVPGAHGPVLGVVPWRGALVPVVHAAGAARGTASPAYVVLLRVADRRCGLAADEVAGVMRADPGALRPVAGRRREHDTRAVRVGGRLYTLLEPDRLQPIADRGVPVMETRQAEAQLQIVTFRIGSQEFGLDVFQVHEILRHQPVTPVPESPDFVEGVTEVRGDLIPVIDMRRRFEAPEARAEGDTRIVVVPFGEDRLGLIVDTVSEVLRLPESTVSDPPEYVRGIAARYLRGIVRAEDRLIVLLDIDAILTSEERIALEEMEVEGPESGGDGDG